MNRNETVLRSRINDRSRKAIQHLISDLKCHDVWQVLVKKPTHTYYDKSTDQYSRLDYIYTYVCQCADDTTLTLVDETSMKNATQLINKFTQVSGLSLNIQKSIGIWLGPLKNGPNLCEGISFTQDPVKCLGIYIG